MPAPINQALRFRVINACLTDKKKPYPTIEDFKSALKKNDIKVSQRAIEGDLESMRYDKRLGFFAPIQYSKKHKGYYYTDPEYSIEKLPLTKDELQAFELLVDALQRFRGAQVLDQVQGMFDKLDKVVMQQLKTKSKESYPVVDFEKMPYVKGIEHFDPLYQAIVKQHPLSIEYKKFSDDKPTIHIFHPYLLKEYKFRWYVLGYSDRRRGKLTLALDRIEKISVVKGEYKPNKGADVENYFKHTLGITLQRDPVQDIKLWFSPSQGNYIKTQHLHATQEIISDGPSGMIVKLRLIPNYELIQLLLSFGPEVKVLEPASLSKEVKEKLKQSLQLY